MYAILKAYKYEIDLIRDDDGQIQSFTNLIIAQKLSKAIGESIVISMDEAKKIDDIEHLEECKEETYLCEVCKEPAEDFRKKCMNC